LSFSANGWNAQLCLFMYVDTVQGRHFACCDEFIQWLSVFPINPWIDKLLESTKGISDNTELLSKEGLANIFDAVDHIRSKALIRDTCILA
jgi:hypothetical protein